MILQKIRSRIVAGLGWQHVDNWRGRSLLTARQCILAGLSSLLALLGVLCSASAADLQTDPAAADFASAQGGMNSGMNTGMNWADLQALQGAYGRMSARTPAQSCIAAINLAEARYGIPKGLLQAIAKVETGRPDPSTGRIEPWPWSVNVNNQGMYFQNLEQSVRWVRRMKTEGITSIDTGCLQVNLQQHPAAFRTLEDAFDPVQNADYAARFLVQLQRETGDWIRAAGLYHSRTPALSDGYRSKVQHVYAGSAASRQETMLSQLKSAWASTLHSTANHTGVSGWNVTLQPAVHPLPIRTKGLTSPLRRAGNQHIRLADY